MAIRQRGKKWFVDFWYRGKRYRKVVSTHRKQAELALKKSEIAIAENKFLDVQKKSTILFKDMAQEYLDRYSKVNKRSYSKDIYTVKTLSHFFNGKLLSEINPLLIEDYKAKKLNEGYANATVNRELALLKHIYSKAMEWGKINDNPVKRVKLLRENNQRLRYLEKGEIEALVSECSEFLKPIVLIAVNTGMRQGEILGLMWDDIDFARGIITLRNTKNGEKRYAPMNSNVRNVLDAVKATCNVDSPLVFCDSHGRSRSRFGDLRGCFERAVKRAGIKDFHFHDLRHTFASHLVMAGADILTVKELLGHKTLTMTLRYSHLSPDYKKSTVELLCSKLGTVWAQSAFDGKQAELTPVKNLLYNKAHLKHAEVAELADARDLKSRVPHGA